MIHSAAVPDLLTGNTFEAIRQLAAAGIINEEIATSLTADYSLLRRVEHFLQILEDRQVHSLPTDEAHRQALARRIAGGSGDSTGVLAELDRVRTRVREIFEGFLQTGNVPG